MTFNETLFLLFKK